MSIILFRVILLVFITVSAVSAQSRIEYAAKQFREGNYDDVRITLKSLLYAPGEEQEAAMYLLLRVEVAERNGAAALTAADRLLSMYPRGDYTEYAHFARAEAYYVLENFGAAEEELGWVSRNAGDGRLVAEADRAAGMLRGETDAEIVKTEAFTEFEPAPASGRYALREGRVALILSFPDSDDPAAADLQRGFRFAADYGNAPYAATIVRVGSPFEAASAARDLMNDSRLLALMFAGDDGSGLAIALLSREYGVPVIKLNTSAESFTAFSPVVYEFLPSTERQAEELARYATNVLKEEYALILTPEDEDGRANKAGFTRGITSSGGTIDAVTSYPSTATNVRRELAKIFSSEPRLARGESALKTLLSRKEREALFGDGDAGEVLEAAAAEAAHEDTITTRESFFFALSPENIDNYSSQLSIIPERTTLFGNSSWIDVGALGRQSPVTNGMYIAAPLLPFAPDTSAYAARYETATGAQPGPWELLGLDAGEYLGQVMLNAPDSRQEFMRLLNRGTRFEGLSVVVEFDSNHENRFARILKHHRGNLYTVR